VDAQVHVHVHDRCNFFLRAYLRRLNLFLCLLVAQLILVQGDGAHDVRAAGGGEDDSRQCYCGETETPRCAHGHAGARAGWLTWVFRSGRRIYGRHDSHRRIQHAESE
jgi:hypothetical protein